MEERQEPGTNTDEAKKDQIDLERRQTYRVLIKSSKLVTPIDEFVDLPVYLADDYIESKKEKVLTASQEVKREELVAYLNNYFSAGTNDDLFFTSENITIEQPTITESD